MPSNKSTPKELQEIQDKALTDPQGNTPPANTPPVNNPAPELEEIRAKENDALTDDERQLLTDHASELTEEERTKFNIQTPTTPTPELEEEELELPAILNKEKEDLTDAEITYLEDHADELTDEQREQYGIIAKPAKQNPPTNQPPVEERYRQSTIEAQVLTAKQKKFNQTVKDAANLPEPTEEELRAEYPDWDVMDDTAKKLAKKSLMNERRFGMVVTAVEEGRKIDEWTKKVDDFVATAITKPEFARLTGKEEEFKSFCMKPTRRGVDLEDLAKAFLHDATDTPAPRKKGSLLEPGSGGGTPINTEESMDENQLAQLRTKDQKTYNRLIKEGKIKPKV